MNRFTPFFLISILLLASCAKNKADGEGRETDFSKLKFKEKVPLTFAEQFKIERDGDYSLITIENEGRYLLLAPGCNPKKVANLPDGITVIKKPLKNVYMVSSAAMDYVLKVGALDSIRFSSVAKRDWLLPKAKEAMENRKIVFAGKYRAPDYEQLLSGNCGLAIENTMIHHKPEVKEKLEEIGIPVIVERASYENNPLGRLEWIKFYGELFGKEKEAEKFFKAEMANIKPILKKKNEEQGKSIVFFYITSHGTVNVRKPGDYIHNIIKLSGGRYALENIQPEEENALSAMNLQFEEFYEKARDADIIIYNTNINGDIKYIAELKEINPLFMDFKAVKEGNVYSTSKAFFQESTAIARFISDFHKIQTEEEPNLSYLTKLK